MAHGLTQSSDQQQIAPLLDAIEANFGRKPDEVSADAGYCSKANLGTMAGRGIEASIAAGRAKRPA